MDDETSIITQVSKENDDQQPLRDLSSESNGEGERGTLCSYNYVDQK